MSRSKLKSSELSPSHSQVPGEFGHEAEAQSSSRFDDEMTRLNNLNLINASARYDLLHVNQQLIDFKIGQVKAQQKTAESKADRIDLDSQKQQ